MVGRVDGGNIYLMARRDQAQDAPTGCLSDLLPPARSHLLKLPEFPQIVPQAGIQSLSPWAHEIISYSDHPEVLVVLKVEVRMANNINLSDRKLAFRADFSSY